jgi:hypothetical protein
MSRISFHGARYPGVEGHDICQIFVLRHIGSEEEPDRVLCSGFGGEECEGHEYMPNQDAQGKETGRVKFEEDAESAWLSYLS